MNGPSFIELCEVGPRDGFQYEATPIPTELKLDTINGLIQAGIPRIQVASFVHPEKVPQMADAEAIVEALPLGSVTVFSGLCLNRRGVVRAAASGLSYVDLSIATNEKHGLDNTGMTVEQGVSEAVLMVEEAERLGLHVQLGLQTVFGFKEPGDTNMDEIVSIAQKFRGAAIESISLADTTGLANPLMIRDRVRAVQSAIGNIPIVLHLHDTRGLGLANIFAAWEEGVARFDASFGGLGGCPFIAGAAGNVPTEDVVYLFDSLGVQTGINTARVAACSRKIAEHLGRALPGKLYSLV